MSSKPLISIIVPVYNVAPYLSRAINSLLAQTHTHLEIILINDGSTDDSGSMCDTLAQQDSRIMVIHQQNEGVSIARNKGLDVATGEWIGFVDPDDWVEPDMFELLLNSAATNDVDVSACGFRKQFENGFVEARELTKLPNTMTCVDALAYVLQGKDFDGYLWNKLFSARLIKQKSIKFIKDFHTCQDLVFVVDALSKGSQLSCVSKPLYCYQIRAGSKTQTFNDKRLTELDARRRVIALSTGISKQYEQVAKCSYTAAAVNLIRDAVVGKRLDVLPAIKKEAMLYIWPFLSASKIDFRFKIRAIMIIFFPKASIGAWVVIKSKLNISWWYKELKKGDNT